MSNPENHDVFIRFIEDHLSDDSIAFGVSVEIKDTVKDDAIRFELEFDSAFEAGSERSWGRTARVDYVACRNRDEDESESKEGGQISYVHINFTSIRNLFCLIVRRAVALAFRAQGRARASSYPR